MRSVGGTHSLPPAPHPPRGPVSAAHKADASGTQAVFRARHGLEKPGEARPAERDCVGSDCPGRTDAFSVENQGELLTLSMSLTIYAPSGGYISVLRSRKKYMANAFFTFIPKLIYIFDYKDNITTTPEYPQEPGRK